MGEQVRTLENSLHGKYHTRLAQAEKDFTQGMLALNNAMAVLEKDFAFIKGPLIDDFKKMRHESLGAQ